MSPERISRTSPVCAKSLSAVLLDLDDTLYPEREFARGGFRAAAAVLAERLQRSSDELFELLWLSFERGVRGSIFDTVLAELNVPRDDVLIAELVRAYRSHEPQLSLFEDADRLFEVLWPRYGLGLLTDGPADVQRRKVKALGLQSRVEAIVYSDDFGREHWKPSPIPYLELLRKMHIDPSHAVYVGDNPKKDFIGARRLGLQTVRIRRPDTEHGHVEPSPGFEADCEITSLDSLLNWLVANERSGRHAA
ncbi:haloacid dehalogenase [Planctomycetia bacterium]|nr:haloacid dehalogenase [Planctomycetia bacterium]